MGEGAGEGAGEWALEWEVRVVERCRSVLAGARGGLRRKNHVLSRLKSHQTSVRDHIDTDSDPALMRPDGPLPRLQ